MGDDEKTIEETNQALLRQFAIRKARVAPSASIAERADIDDSLAGFGEQWREGKNPLYAWYSIEICARLRKPLPDWVNTYLHEVAQNIVKLRFEKVEEVRNVLPEALQFVREFTGPKGSRAGAGGHFAKAGAVVLREQRAVVFAARVYEGSSPAKAYKEIASQRGLTSRGERTIQRDIRSYFGIGKDVSKKQIASTEWWQKFLDQWAREDHHNDVFLYYCDEYPSLKRTLFDFRQKSAD